jgi:putative transposase
MARPQRIAYEGAVYHVTARGNERRTIFRDDADHERFLRVLGESVTRFEVRLYLFCLMSNHVHLVAIPHEEEALAQAVGRTHFRYTRHVNRLHRRSGHLWQGRFYSCALDGRHLWPALKYVELNPVRAKLCRRAWQYAWSSAALHVDEKAESELLNLPHWYKQVSAQEWRRELAEGLTGNSGDTILNSRVAIDTRAG